MTNGLETENRFYQYGFYDRDLCQVIQIQGEPKGRGPSYRRRWVEAVSEWEEIPRDEP